MFSDRTAALIGEEGIEKLRSARVAVFGIGGVGGYVAEALARSGVGHIDLIDSDVVTETNINRQIIALTSTLGKPKAEVMRERIADINPSAEVVAHNLFYSEETADSFDLGSYDYVADAIDSVKSKLALINGYFENDELPSRSRHTPRAPRFGHKSSDRSGKRRSAETRRHGSRYR